jgi:hypothetical protein
MDAPIASDFEIAIPMHKIQSFVDGTGYYADLPKVLRLEQIDHWRRITDTLHPHMRQYLFDARRLYCVPVTVFGHLLPVIYVGRTYLAFRDTQRMRAFSDHFDHLVRETSIAASAVPDHLDTLQRNLLQKGIGCCLCVSFSAVITSSLKS